MSQTASRRNQKLYIPKGERRRIREIILKRDGNYCCWCFKPMLIPERGVCLSDASNMATIEHYFALEAEQPEDITLMRLAHHKCNR